MHEAHPFGGQSALPLGLARRAGAPHLEDTAVGCERDGEGGARRRLAHRQPLEASAHPAARAVGFRGVTSVRNSEGQRCVLTCQPLPNAATAPRVLHRKGYRQDSRMPSQSQQHGVRQAHRHRRPPCRSWNHSTVHNIYDSVTRALKAPPAASLLPTLQHGIIKSHARHWSIWCRSRAVQGWCCRAAGCKAPDPDAALNCASAQQ